MQSKHEGRRALVSGVACLASYSETPSVLLQALLALTKCQHYQSLLDKASLTPCSHGYPPLLYVPISEVRKRGCKLDYTILVPVDGEITSWPPPLSQGSPARLRVKRINFETNPSQ